MTTDTRHADPRKDAEGPPDAASSIGGTRPASRNPAAITCASSADILEQTFATEIARANWRLRRCGILEFDVARAANPAPGAQTAIRNSEIRKLRTERHTRIVNFPCGGAPTDPGVTDARQTVRRAAQSILAASSFCKPPQSAAVIPEKPINEEPAPEKPTASNPAGSSFCKPAPAAPAGSSFCKPPQPPPPVVRFVNRLCSSHNTGKAGRQFVL